MAKCNCTGMNLGAAGTTPTPWRALVLFGVGIYALSVVFTGGSPLGQAPPRQLKLRF